MRFNANPTPVEGKSEGLSVDSTVEAGHAVLDKRLGVGSVEARIWPHEVPVNKAVQAGGGGQELAERRGRDREVESLEAQRTEGGGEGQAAEIGETGGSGHLVSPAGRDVAGRGADAAKREVDERCETQSYSERTRGHVVGEPLAHSARKLPERHFGPNSGAKRKHGNEEAYVIVDWGREVFAQVHGAAEDDAGSPLSAGVSENSQDHRGGERAVDSGPLGVRSPGELLGKGAPKLT